VLELLKTMWRGWKRFTHGINDVISVVLMTFVYITAVAPVSLGFKIARPDPIDRGLGDPHADSWSQPVAMTRQDVRRAQRPW